MLLVNATEAKNNFGRYLEASVREPVQIQKSGRRVAVIISAEEFDRLREMEDAYWGERALAALESGFVGSEGARRALTRTVADEESHADAGPDERGR